MTKQIINTSTVSLIARFVPCKSTSPTRTYSMIRSSLISGLIFISTPVYAGTFTDAPGALQGDIAVRHQFQMNTDSIFQEEQLIGERSLAQNTTTLAMKIGLVDFMSADISMPVGSESLVFSNVYEMKYDPLSQTGSYLDTPNIDDVTRTGKGLQGTEFALNFTLFTQRFIPTGEMLETGKWAWCTVRQTRVIFILLTNQGLEGLE